MEPWNTLQILLFFFVALLLFHLLFVWRATQTPLFWKRADYFWVSFGLLGLIASTGELRRFRSTWVIEQQRIYTDTRRQNVRWIVDSDLQIHSAAARYRSEFSPPDFDSLVAAEEAYADWLTAFRVSLPDSTLEDGFVRLKETFGRPAFYNDQYSSELDRLSTFIDDAAKAEMELAAEEDAADLSKFETILMHFGPFLFSLALALRFTKVTAEVRFAKRNN